MSVEADADLASELAEAAGEALLALRATGLTGTDLGSQGDRLANRLLLDALAARRPLDCVLSEEEPESDGRCARSRVWIVDPLDGTREYAAGHDDWAVHVGLAIEGEPVAGAVALPPRGRVLSSARVVPPPPRADARLRVAVSRSRPPRLCERVAVRLGALLVPMGSAGVKAMAVVEGRVDAYLHAGGQFEWDNCAPVAVALAAGLHCSRVDGAPLRYNEPDPSVPDLLVCRPELATVLLEALAHCA